MPLVVSQEGALMAWQSMLQILNPGSLYIHLLGNAYTPLHTSTYSLYSANELVVAGYARQLLTNSGANWTFAPVTAGESATYDLLTWTFTASCTVYGYYLAWDGAAISFWGELFAVYFTFPSGGGAFTLSLPPTLTSQP